MSGVARDWLPVAALDAPAVRRALGDAVESWSDRWFPGARLTAAGFAARTRGGALPALAWRQYGTAAALAGDTLRLAGLALGTRPEGLVLSEVDRDIIGRFATRILADLACALDRAIGRDPPADEPETPAGDPLPDGGLAFAVADGAGAPVLHGAVPLAALVPFRKSLLGPGHRPRRPALARLGRAVGVTPVRLEARLGAAAVALGELAALAPGDVLILDRAIGEGASLALPGSGRCLARAAIAERGAGISLTLSSPSGDL
ncbi:MAG TPA: FliM/FliN family flagellar motor switch protein [Allosphingosinicella sp.]|nr:FliM/FliN family flagellar motor switch protein [Allosphingosinicella sp.]